MHLLFTLLKTSLAPIAFGSKATSQPTVQKPLEPGFSHKCNIPGRYLPANVLHSARRQWLTPVILSTQEAEIRRITVRSQPRQIVHKTLSLKTYHKKWLVE
jgi:hypothetical protein